MVAWCGPILLPTLKGRDATSTKAKNKTHKDFRILSAGLAVSCWIRLLPGKPPRLADIDAQLRINPFLPLRCLGFRCLAALLVHRQTNKTKHAFKHMFSKGSFEQNASSHACSFSPTCLRGPAPYIYIYIVLPWLAFCSKTRPQCFPETLGSSSRVEYLSLGTSRLLPGVESFVSFGSAVLSVRASAGARP